MVSYKVLRKAVLMAVSAGAVFSVPVCLPQQVCPVGTAQAEAAQKAVAWDFKSDMAGWKYGGKYAYKGKPQIMQDAAFGGSIRIDADYTAHLADSWSEIKVEYGKAAAEPLDISGMNVFSFDLYFKPQAMTQGSFKTKLYAKSVAGQEVINVYPDIDLSKAKDAGKGMKVVHVVVPFDPSDVKVSYFCMSLVGSMSDYKGPLFLKNVKLAHEKVADGYVNRMVAPQSKRPVDITKLAIPTEVKLADPQALPQTADLLAYLSGIASSDYVIYGHQNDLHRKVGTKLPGPSDTYDIVKDDAGLMGFDGLALTGNELELTEAERTAGITLTDKLAAIYIKGAREGGILSMSCHMPNFAQVAKRPKIDGKYDYSGYSPVDLSGDVVQRIMPGGDLNPVFTGYLDMVAGFDKKLQDAGIPLIFRPFHENNGAWFWWGASSCSPSQFKNLFRYTEEYLRNTKGLHNMLYAYSPGGPIKDEADYASRYPGDEYVDIIGFDMYHREPQKQDNWMDELDRTEKAVAHFATRHGKVAAGTEVGMIENMNGGCLLKRGAKRPDWFNEVLAKTAPNDIAYFMTWSNFNENNFCQPYMVDTKRGHEMINSFTQFYNNPETVFAHSNADYMELNVKAAAAAETYGYITSPGAFDRELGAFQLTANVFGKPHKAQFILKRKDGTQAAVIDAVLDGAGHATAEADEEDLAQLGVTVGQAALVIDDREVDSVAVLYNMPAPEADPYLVDDFESYYGDEGILKGAYSTNSGAASYVTPALVTAADEHEAGESGLAFHYHIAKGGYTGIIKNLKGVDWSKADAVQFWLKPDGKAQKLIVQLNSGGEDFEVDLTELAKTTAAKVITLPFSEFKGKNGGTFDKSAVQHFAIYCNTIGNDTVDSTMYFDDIKAVEQ